VIGSSWNPTSSYQMLGLFFLQNSGTLIWTSVTFGMNCLELLLPVSPAVTNASQVARLARRVMFETLFRRGLGVIEGRGNQRITGALP
jgi:hypothetical protein